MAGKGGLGSSVHAETERDQSAWREVYYDNVPRIKAIGARGKREANRREIGNSGRLRDAASDHRHQRLWVCTWTKFGYEYGAYYFNG